MCFQTNFSIVKIQSELIIKKFKKMASNVVIEVENVD